MTHANNQTVSEGNGLRVKFIPASEHPVGSIDAPGWMYAGVSPNTGKDFWIQTRDISARDHFEAVAYAKEQGARLVFPDEGTQLRAQKEQLGGNFDSVEGYWLQEDPANDYYAPVQWFNSNGQNTNPRHVTHLVFCARDTDPRLTKA